MLGQIRKVCSNRNKPLGLKVCTNTRLLCLPLLAGLSRVHTALLLHIRCNGMSCVSNLLTLVLQVGFTFKIDGHQIKGYTRTGHE